MKKKSVDVILKGLNVNCKGVYNITTNKLTILTGSIIRKKVSKGFKYNKKRQEQIADFCEERSRSYVLIKDAEFDTPSAAAKFSLGYEVNGPVYWKTDDNKKLKDYINKQ